MNNFTFRNPTKLVFGKDSIQELPKLLPSDAKILLTFGGGSVKRNGVYEAVISQLSGFQTVEFWGIEPNPKVETLRKAIALGKQEGVTFVLAVGGGSVLDASKLIVNAIPSELNRGAVISSEATHEKFGFYNEYPLFSILDPSYTYSLPDYQIACGIADSFIHVVEQYLTRVGESPLMDRWAEGILLTLIEEADKIKAQPADYDARATFMLSATMALNGFISMGVTQDWATHRIGHEITALTGLTHGHTLVIVLPALLREQANKGKHAKLLQYASRIWGLTEGSEDERITQAIDKTEAFFRSLGLETRLAERGFGDDLREEVVRRFRERGTLLGEDQDIDHEAVARILARC